MHKILQFILLMFLVLEGAFVFSLHERRRSPVVISKPEIVEIRPERQPDPVLNYDLTEPLPSYLDYEAIKTKLREWELEAPELVEVGVYGKSGQGKDLVYIRVRNERDDLEKPRVLITGAIHGNEPWSTSTVMCYIGTLIDQYGDNDQITKIVNARDLYFVPIISPDSFPQSRYVDGVDPNRNFPSPVRDSQSVSPIKEIQDFFFEIRPRAVISGHTFGRVFLQPWGYTRSLPANEKDFQEILGRMADMCRYRLMRCCENYGHPIIGSEVDWYYWNGAFSVVMEFGGHQRPPSREEIISEFNRTFQGVLYFIEEAPKVEILFFH